MPETPKSNPFQILILSGFFRLPRALLQAFLAAMASAVKLFFAFNFFMGHDVSS
jgi:hypothetical protein